MLPVLGYWCIRGLGQPIRLLLNYVGQEFEDKRYFYGPAPDYHENWLKEKFNRGLDFPNLPYYIDGDTKITQSNAILRHIARKHNMCGETDKEKTIVDMLAYELIDFKNGFSGLCYNPNNYEENKNMYLDNVVIPVKAFADFLAEKKYLAGEKITYVDFAMYEYLDIHKAFERSLLEPHTNLKAFMDRIEALPTIAKYLKSDKFEARPINGPMANFL